MKLRKLLMVLLVMLFGLSIVSCKKKSDEQSNPSPSEPSPSDPEPDPEPQAEAETVKHLILNADKTYGGSYDEALYGYGTPQDGEYDIEDTIYYSIINYYQRGTTSTRKLFKNFKPYQKTMANTDGIACLVSLFNYWGLDTSSTFSEYQMMLTYNQINSADLSTTTCTTEGLSNLISELGLTCEDSLLVTESEKPTKSTASAWFKERLADGKGILVPYHDGTSGWILIVGCDDMGTSTTEDDIVIFMDPNDILDHYQDGWGVVSTDYLVNWWNKTLANGYKTMVKEYILVDAPANFDKDKALELTEDISVTMTNPENHLLVEPNGSLVSNYYVDLFNQMGSPVSATAKRRSEDYKTWSDVALHHPESYYFARPDVYNMKTDDASGIYCLNHYRSHEQDMPSTCGICSFVNIMNYYGFDVMCEDSIWSEAQVAWDYESATSANIQGRGIGASNVKTLLTSTKWDGKYSNLINVIYCGNQSAMGSSAVYTEKAIANLKYPTVESLVNDIKKYLSQKVPIATSWNPGSGHWTQIIGLVTFDDENIHNDLIIIGDSSDRHDQYYDGYGIFPVETFYNRWFNGSHSLAQACYIFTIKNN